MDRDPMSPRRHKKSYPGPVRQISNFLSISILSILATGIAGADEIEWHPGLEGDIPFSPAIRNVVDFGAVGDGVTDDSDSFQDALDSLPVGGGAVLVPPGTYLLKTTIYPGDGAVLRGSGAAVTHLRFDLGGRAEYAIEVITYGRGPWIDTESGYNKGSTEILVTDASSFTIPTFAEIQQTNDPDVMYTDPYWNQIWARDSVGEIIRVVGKVGNRLILQDSLRFTYDPAMNPIIRSQEFIENVGIEHLHIFRIDGGNGETIYLKNAAWVWIREVESEMTVRSHVGTETVYGCEIRDSFFHDAHDYGGGGHGYGVSLGFHTTSCLVEDNVFSHLRHAMVIALGASGNVFGYNHSREATSEGTWQPDDITLHGHYPFANLFESNVVQSIGVGDFWGPAGPENTFLRNCILDIGIKIYDHSHNQFVIGNTLPTGPSNWIEIDPSVQNTTVHGNFVGGEVQWDPGNPDHTITESLYLSGRPWFFGQTLPWPIIGGDLGVTCSNPAKLRWEQGEATPGVTPIFHDGFESGTTGFWVVDSQ